MIISAPKHTPEELALRAEAVRQANASLALEGFFVSPEVAELNRRYVLGEIGLDEKLELIRKLYGHK
jgi:hypothetical protein